MRERTRVTQVYRDVDRTPSVPAFVVSAKQIISDIDSITRGQRTARTPATGTNNEVLEPRASNKRNADAMSLVFFSPKRARTRSPATPTVIDLTQDDEPSSEFIPSRRPTSRPALADITNRGSQKRRKKPYPTREQDTHRESLGALAKIASKLRASAHALVVDRETLRRRWEVDEGLQLQHVTDHLADLNECFTTAENGIHGALDIIERGLL